MPPTSARKLGEFLGLINLYCHFLPHYAQMLHPLTDILSAKHTSSPFHLNSDAIATFQAITAALANATTLTHSSTSAPYCLMTDASNIAIKRVLQQRLNGTWQPISFFSKNLKPAAMN